MKKKIASLQTLVIQVCWTTLYIYPYWISTPYIWKHKNQSKASSGAGIFTQNLQACKKSQYNVGNCKSRRHNQGHTFRHCNSRYRPTSTNILYYDLKVKGKKKEILKHHLLAKDIQCSMQSSIIIIFLFWVLQECYHLCYLLMNQTYVMITYLWTQNIIIDYVVLTKMI